MRKRSQIVLTFFAQLIFATNLFAHYHMVSPGQLKVDYKTNELTIHVNNPVHDFLDCKNSSHLFRKKIKGKIYYRDEEGRKVIVRRVDYLATLLVDRIINEAIYFDKYLEIPFVKNAFVFYKEIKKEEKANYKPSAKSKKSHNHQHIAESEQLDYDSDEEEEVQSNMFDNTDELFEIIK